MLLDSALRSRIDRREFLKSTALLATGTAYFAAGGFRELLATQSQPFEILAIGDALVWGQGLRDDQKFTHHVVNYLKSKLPRRDVHLHMLAHSGAQIPPHADDNKAPRPGEVPSLFPSISAQVANAPSSLPAIHAAVNPENVALILLSGGLTDVGIKRLLTPDPTSDASAVREATRTHCVAEMSKLLRTVLSTFPNAKVVLVNYWPLISAESDPLRVAALVQHWDVSDTVDANVLAQLVRQSDAFYEETTRGFRAVVAIHSGVKSAAKLGSLGDPKLNRVALAEVAFTARNAYAAPLPFLFQLQEPDSVVSARMAHCVQYGTPGPLCMRAAAAHPNARGAAAYGSAVINALQPMLSELSGAHRKR